MELFCREVIPGVVDLATEPARARDVMSVSEEFWEDFYRGGRGTWSGEANPLLVEEASRLTPGTALDLAAGRVGTPIWLASQGWRVTAVDVSATALELAAQNAAAAGVTEAIRWQRHDLTALLGRVAATPARPA